MDHNIGRTDTLPLFPHDDKENFQLAVSAIVNDSEPIKKCEQYRHAYYCHVLSLQNPARPFSSRSGAASVQTQRWMIRLLDLYFLEYYRRLLQDTQQADLATRQLSNLVEAEANLKSVQAAWLCLNNNVWKRCVLRKVLEFQLTRRCVPSRVISLILDREDFLKQERVWEDRVFARVHARFLNQASKYKEHIQRMGDSLAMTSRKSCMNEIYSANEHMLRTALDVEDAAQVAVDDVMEIDISETPLVGRRNVSRFSRRKILNLGRQTMKYNRITVKRKLMWNKFEMMTTAGISSTAFHEVSAESSVTPAR